MFAGFKKLIIKSSSIATVLSMLAFTVVLAASGDLDTTFDGDGKVIDFASPSDPGRYDMARGIAIQADGKIVVAGDSLIPDTTTWDFAVLRYKGDGSSDSTFSGDGKLLTNFNGVDQALDVALQDNGKIVAAGQQCKNHICDVALARYNSGGALDTTFSGDGKQTNDFGGGDNGTYGGIAIQSNGKIVVSGYMWNGTDYDFAVYRYLSSGTLDTTFSGDGMVNISFGAGRHDIGMDVVIQSDGKIVVAGYTHNVNTNQDDFAVARLNAGGSLDATFSGDGKQTKDLGSGSGDFAYAVALQPDGKLIIAGERNRTGSRAFALTRFNTDGSPDTTFGSSGAKFFSITTNADSFATDVLVQPDGKIVMLGNTQNAGFYDFALVRLKSGGGFDTTFSGDGKVTVDFGGNDFCTTLAIQPSDGSYILGGYTDDGSQRDIALARVLP